MQRLIVCLLSPLLLLASELEPVEPELAHWPSPPWFRPDSGSAKKADRAAATSPLELVAITPCRAVDTRSTAAIPFAGPAFQTGETRDYPLSSSLCGIPATARAYSLNFTVDQTGFTGVPFLTAWPTGEPRPTTSILNAPNPAVQFLANAAVIPVGRNQQISVFASAATHLIIDINGYYVEGGSALPAAVYADATPTPPIQSAPNGVPVRLAPGSRQLDTGNAVTQNPWTFRAPRDCVYEVLATARSPLALPGGFHRLAVVSGGVPIAEEIASPALAGVPATVSVATHVPLTAGSDLWLEYLQTFVGQGGLSSRVSIVCVRPLP